MSYNVLKPQIDTFYFQASGSNPLGLDYIPEFVGSDIKHEFMFSYKRSIEFDVINDFCFISAGFSFGVGYLKEILTINDTTDYSSIDSDYDDISFRFRSKPLGNDKYLKTDIPYTFKLHAGVTYELKNCRIWAEAGCIFATTASKETHSYVAGQLQLGIAYSFETIRNALCSKKSK